MTRSSLRIFNTHPGMTLAEVVIAIAIIASTVPLILAATSAAHRARQFTQTDTHSAWLVRDAQRRICNEWAQSGEKSDLGIPFPFPTEDSPEATMELAYRKDGTFIPADDTDQAVYFVSVKAEPYLQTAHQAKGLPLALVSIEIQADSNKRKKLNYRYISTREGIL